MFLLQFFPIILMCRWKQELSNFQSVFPLETFPFQKVSSVLLMQSSKSQISVWKGKYSEVWKFEMMKFKPAAI